jgi:hypothetical protein
MVQGRDRRVELGYQWAIEARKGIIYPPKNKNSKFNPPPPGTVTVDPAKPNAEDSNANNPTEVTASA